MLSILGRMLFQNGLKYVYLCGEMGSNDQEMCIRAFQGVPEIKVMVSTIPSTVKASNSSIGTTS
jgi:SNF2 family DNA or RNA helicase